MCPPYAGRHRLQDEAAHHWGHVRCTRPSQRPLEPSPQPIPAPSLPPSDGHRSSAMCRIDPRWGSRRITRLELGKTISAIYSRIDKTDMKVAVRMSRKVVAIDLPCINSLRSLCRGLDTAHPVLPHTTACTSTELLELGVSTIRPYFQSIEVPSTANSRHGRCCSTQSRRLQGHVRERLPDMGLAVGLKCRAATAQ
jgi:hypothetical protein